MTEATTLTRVCITFQMQNDFETAEQCIIIPMKFSTAERLYYYLANRDRPTPEDCGVYSLVNDLCSTAALLMGYSLLDIVSAEEVPQ